jgi:molecular chaperone Hsp33
MSQLHKFLFEGLPVRGMLVRLTDAWTDMLRRREAAGQHVGASCWARWRRPVC